MSEFNPSDLATPGPNDTGDVSTDEQENAPRAAEQQAAEQEHDSGETLGSPTAERGAERDPQEWVTGDEPATGPQKSYLDTLARQAGEEISADLTKAEASQHIERLQGEKGSDGS